MSNMYFAFGKCATMKEWAEIAGIDYDKFRSRVRKHGIEGALAIPNDVVGAITKDRLEVMKLLAKKKIVPLYDEYMMERNYKERESKVKEEEVTKMDAIIKSEESKKLNRDDDKSKGIYEKSIYKVTYFEPVNAGAGYWRTRKMKGSELLSLLNSEHRHSVDSYEVSYD